TCKTVNSSMKIKSHILYLLSFLGLCACGTDYYFEKYYDIDNAVWTYDNTLDYEIDIQDTSSIYDLYLNLQHSPEYPYQNLYIRIQTHFPKGEKLEETLSVNLANKAGLWHGDCNTQRCKLQIPIQEGAFFNQAGSYRFTIEQYMRVPALEGIRQIGMALKDTGMKR
ncbi:MAG: gliding motility lipoprotein GldH, partial [Bacteroidota bacterium]